MRRSLIIYQVIVIDEVFTCPVEMLHAILEFVDFVRRQAPGAQAERPLMLATGDPFQLPPIARDDGAIMGKKARAAHEKAFGEFRVAGETILGLWEPAIQAWKAKPLTQLPTFMNSYMESEVKAQVLVCNRALTRMGAGVDGTKPEVWYGMKASPSYGFYPARVHLVLPD